MKIPIAAIAVALSIAPIYAQTSGPSHIQGVESDEFSNIMKINGVVESENPFGGIFRSWSLRSFVSKLDGSTTHQLYVSIDYPSEPGRKVFDSASDDTATPLTVTQIYGNDNSEDAAIEVTTAVLRAHALTGYRVKISAESGDSFILTISSNQIAAQLDTMEKCLEYIHARSNVVDNQHGPYLLEYAKLGFKASEITDEIAAKTGLHKGRGIVVFEVTPGSIAERSGLKVLDRIMVVPGCGSSMDSLAAMKKCIVKHKTYIGMVVNRGGDLTTVGLRFDTEGR
ncbi:MAG: hypothetical protein WBD78_04245 [Methylocella sp.]